MPDADTSEKFVIGDVVDYIDITFKSGPIHELNALKHIRSPIQDQLGDEKRYNITRVLIDEAMERLLNDAKSVALSRLSYVDHMNKIVTENSRLRNSLLYIGQILKLKIRRSVIDTDSGDVSASAVEINPELSVNADELVAVAVMAKNKIKDITETYQKNAVEVKRLTEDLQLRDGKLKSQELQLKDLRDEAANPKYEHFDGWVIYNPSRARFLYFVAAERPHKKKKGVMVKSYEFSSSKDFRHSAISLSLNEALTALKQAFRKKDLSVKGIANYEIRRMSFGAKEGVKEIAEAIQSLTVKADSK